MVHQYFKTLKDENGNPLKDDKGNEVRQKEAETKTVYRRVADRLTHRQGHVKVTPLNGEKYLFWAIH